MSSWNKIDFGRKLVAAAALLTVLAAGAVVFGEDLHEPKLIKGHESQPTPLPLPRGDFRDKDWKAEFDDICSHTDHVMALSRDEISGLIERCDRLRPSIEQLDESLKKVYLRRLQLCRNLYAFALDSLKDK